MRGLCGKAHAFCLAQVPLGLRGAALFSQAKQAGTSVVMLWTSGNAGSRLDLGPQAQLFPQHAFLEADVTASKVNRDLAGPLQVKSFPLLQVSVAPLQYPI